MSQSKRKMIKFFYPTEDKVKSDDTKGSKENIFIYTDIQEGSVKDMTPDGPYRPTP